MQWLLILRAITSWIPGGPKGNPLFTFFVTLTEPIVAPVRALMDRFSPKSSLPIDMSVFVTYLVLLLIQMAL
jgi:uncharacterized protein YggT (Ycf19 family)